MSRGEIMKAGYLTKSPPEGRVAQWHRRWFVFADSHLVYPLAERYVRMEYYQSEEDAKKLRNPKGVINLQQCSRVTNRENIRGFRHVFDVCTADRTYHLAAESPQDKHDWIDILNTTLFTSHNNQPSQPHNLTTSNSHNTSSQSHTPHPSQNAGPCSIPQPSSRSPDSSSAAHRPKAESPQSFTGDSTASRQNQRPLPPVPGNSANMRPLPPTPPDHAPSTNFTHYRRPPNEPKLPRQSSSQALPASKKLPSQSPLQTQYTSQKLPRQSSSLQAPAGSHNKHALVRQTKSSSCIEEAPEQYLFTSSPSPPPVDRDYANLDYDNLDSQPCEENRHSPPAPSPLMHSSRDYANLEDDDYDDAVSMESCVYEDYVPRASAAPVSTPQPAPISKPRGKGGPVQAKSVGYVNVPNPATSSDDYSVLDPVKPQTPSAPLGGDDYSRLDLTGHLELGPPNPPPSQNGRHGARPRNKDYENMAHLAHPDPGDYSNLQY